MQVFFLFIALCHICFDLKDLTFSSKIYNKILLESLLFCYIKYRCWLEQYGWCCNTGTGPSCWFHLEASEARLSLLPKRIPVCRKHDIYIETNLINISNLDLTSCSCSLRHYASCIPIDYISYQKVDAKNCHKKVSYI